MPDEELYLLRLMVFCLMFGMVTWPVFLGLAVRWMIKRNIRRRHRQRLKAEASPTTF